MANERGAKVVWETLDDLLPQGIRPGELVVLGGCTSRLRHSSLLWLWRSLHESKQPVTYVLTESDLSRVRTDK